MSAETIADARPDDPRTEIQKLTTRAWAWAAILVMGAGFLLVGGGNLDLGPVESRLGMASAEGIGPFGKVFGGWEPGIWPAELAPSVLWAWGEEGMPTAASVRWPAAIAGLLIGVILAHRATTVLGTRAALIVAAGWFGSLALIDRSAGTGIDLISGLAIVAAFDRVLARGYDRVAGCWGALAFLAAGWPPIALLVLAMIVIGRREAALSWRWLGPVGLAVAGWSAWALAAAPSQAWSGALSLPLSESPAWMLVPAVLALSLPWGPFAALVASRTVRDGWPAPARRWVMGWLQVCGVCLLAGTLIPGLGSTARVPALAGLIVAAAACAERVWTHAASPAARRVFVAIAFAIVAAWTLIAVGGGIELASAVSYYRSLAIALILMSLPVALLAVVSLRKGDPRRALAAVALVAVCLKVAHWGYYVPEWNYRRSQGPWGRAIGQWVPAQWPIYTTHAWPADLAFATGRPVRQLMDPKLLAYQPGKNAKFVLLLQSEFTHWPEGAPRIFEVASFQDERGDVRVLARTEGPASWRLARQSRDD